MFNTTNNSRRTRLACGAAAAALLLVGVLALVLRGMPFGSLLAWSLIPLCILGCGLAIEAGEDD